MRLTKIKLNWSRWFTVETDGKIDNIVRKYNNTSFPCQYLQKADFAGNAWTPVRAGIAGHAYTPANEAAHGSWRMLTISSTGVHIYNTKWNANVLVQIIVKQQQNQHPRAVETARSQEPKPQYPDAGVSMYSSTEQTPLQKPLVPGTI